MSQATQIYELVSATGKSAPNMTNALKTIGDGSMQDGIKSMADFFFGSGTLYGMKRGERRGLVKGSLLTLVVGGVILGGIRAKQCYDDYKFRKSLREDGDKILKAMHNSIQDEESVKVEE